MRAGGVGIKQTLEAVAATCEKQCAKASLCEPWADRSGAFAWSEGGGLRRVYVGRFPCEGVEVLAGGLCGMVCAGRLCGRLCVVRSAWPAVLASCGGMVHVRGSYRLDVQRIFWITCGGRSMWEGLDGLLWVMLWCWMMPWRWVMVRRWAAVLIDR